MTPRCRRGLDLQTKEIDGQKILNPVIFGTYRDQAKQDTSLFYKLKYPEISLKLVTW